MRALLLELWPFVALGALGSLHCAGMCGGFAAAVAAAGARGSGAAARRQAGYVLGKAATYATLGLALRSGAGGLARAGLGPVPAWIAGALLIALGMRAWGVRPIPRIPAALGLARLAGPLRAAAGELLRLPGFAGAFGAGALNGLVPCGLSLGAIALGSASSPAAAVLGPFAFGLATAPALGLVGLGVLLLRRAPLRRAAPALLGCAMIAGGVLTALRGAQTGAPGCCPPPGAGPACDDRGAAEPPSPPFPPSPQEP